MQSRIHFAVVLLLCATVLPAAAQAAHLKVNCNDKDGKELSKITAALKQLNPTVPNTLTVSGTCHENVVIQGFERLSLIASPGASITDASNGTLDMVDIGDSQEFSMNGFTVDGGAGGVACFDNSLCRFTGNTIQGSAGHGVVVNASRATFNGDTSQNHAARGLSVIDGGSVTATGITLQGNGDGIVLNTAGFVTVFNSTIRNNQRFGVFAATNSTFRCVPCTITGNGNDGVRLQQNSVARFDSFFGAYSITGNGAAGVSLSDLSFSFFDVGNVTGNSGGTDVVCNPQFSATRGALTNIGGGITNCTEP
jgi:hypothetical protein